MVQAKSTAEPEADATASAAAPNGAAHILADHLTEQEFADDLEVGLRTVRRWRALRQSPPYVVIARRVYYRRAAVEEWLRNRERGFEEPKGRARRSSR